MNVGKGNFNYLEMRRRLKKDNVRPKWICNVIAVYTAKFILASMQLNFSLAKIYPCRAIFLSVE